MGAMTERSGSAHTILSPTEVARAFSAETLSPTFPPLLDLLQSHILSKSHLDKCPWELPALVLTTSGMEGSPGWERDVSGQKANRSRDAGGRVLRGQSCIQVAVA